MSRYICIHCHFYQPPRENPWLESIEIQDSAYPFHDWNERITAECYAPNSASRMVDHQGLITSIVNNYSRISFNFGPTLLSWMESKAPETYQAILEADKQSQERFSGHGSAIAQPYNHMILPLANSSDKWTQIAWGISDFKHRFERTPEGMWLPETAVDMETLDMMAKQGIRFTILAPSQAGRLRRMGGRSYKDVTGARIDPTKPYFVRLSEGRTMSLFFYDGPISRAVAFEGLLNSGERFAERLASGFSEHRDWPQLMHIATDGESYGHHHPHGDMALAFALKHIEHNNIAQLTNYGEYLEKHPPTHEVQILENTAWSCSHGVERWKSNCGCNSGGNPGWNQAWRTPLRDALNWLRDNLRPQFEGQARHLLKDPWLARNEYIDVILDRSPESVNSFFERHASHHLSSTERVLALTMLEMQRHTMLMYTSCGWFFDELSGIETVQVIQYAARAIQLAQDSLGDTSTSDWSDDAAFENGFLERLQLAKSNLPEHSDGTAIYRKWVKPTMINLRQVAAHFAISSLFDHNGNNVEIYCYDVNRKDYQTLQSGRPKMVLGKIEVRSQITHECEDVSFAVLHFGDHNLNAAVGIYREESEYVTMVTELRESFSRADLPAVIRRMDKHFSGVNYSLKSLFGDEQRRIMNIILNFTMVEVEAGLRNIYEHHAPLMHFLAEMRMPKPQALSMTAEFVINASLKRAFTAEYLDLSTIRLLLEQSKEDGIPLDGPGLGYALEKSIHRLMEYFHQEPTNFALLQKIEDILDLVTKLPFAVNLWRTQNIYYHMRTHVDPRFQNEEEMSRWVRHFLTLGSKMRIGVEKIEEPMAALRAG